MLVDFEESIINLPLVLATFEIHLNELLDAEYFAIIIIIIVIKRTSI